MLFRSAIATAAKQIVVDRMDTVVAGGVESISLVQTNELRITTDPQLVTMVPDMYIPMLQTAETVAARYGIGRDRQDAYALRSQQRTADAANQRTGKPEDAAKAGQSASMKYEGAQQAKALAAEQKAMAERVQQLQQTSKALEERMRAAGALDTAMAGQLREAQRM